jgi:hypothetical protein
MITVEVKVWACRTHRHLFPSGCWHGSCRICKQGVTAFDFTEADAVAAVERHIAREHAA